MSASPPKTIGAYEITREVGRGGMGVVYLARDTRLDRAVAIKCLPDSLSHDADRLARFEVEAKTLASLSHPNVAAIYGLEEVAGQRYLILEYVEGDTLEDRLRSGPLPIDEALPIAAQIAAAIDAAHQNGIIHRDLKPANIKLAPAAGDDVTVKVLDFGLAKALGDPPSAPAGLEDSPTRTWGASPTLPGTVLGTAGYLSPEQARGRTLDQRTDVFSFGCVLYEMLTGRRAFPGDTVADAIGAVLHKRVAFEELPAETPFIVRHVLRRCLERDRARRARDIGDVQLELETAQDAEADALAAPERRRSSLLSSVLIGTLLLALLGLGLYWGLAPETEAPRVRRLDLGVYEVDGSMPDAPVISPSGDRVVYKLGERLWVRDLSSFDARELAGTEGAVEPFWSPDGAWIGFGRERYLFKVPSAGGQPEHVATLDGAIGDAGGAAWITDGTLIFTTGGGDLSSVSSGGGRPEIWLPGAEDEVDHHDVAALPGGRGVVFVSHTKIGPWKVSVADGKRRADVIVPIGHRVADPWYAEPGFILFAEEATNAGLWAVPFDVDRFETTGPPFLVAGWGSRGSVSSDGTLAYLRNGSAQEYHLTWLPLDGTASEPLGEAMKILSQPQVNQDGTWVAYVGGTDSSDLIVEEIKSGRRSVIAHDVENAGNPSWSPDSKRLAVSLVTDGTRRITFYSTDGSANVPDDLEGLWASFDATWSSAAIERTGPEGQRGDIWTVSLDTREERPLIATPANETWARVSPDGRWLCYRSDVSGAEEFYLTRYPSGEGLWQVTHGGASRLEWGPRSDRIYYDSADDWALSEVTVDSEEGGAKLGIPRRLFSRSDNGILFFRGFDIPFPGDRVLGVTAHQQSGAARSIGIVQHWYEGIRDRSTSGG